MMLLTLAFLCIFMTACSGAPTGGHNKSEGHKRSLEELEQQAKYKEEMLSFHKKMLKAGIKKGMPMEDVVTKVRELTQAYDLPSKAGKMASIYVEKHLGKDALREYRQLKHLNNNRANKVRAKVGEGGPATQKLWAERAAQFSNLEEELNELGLNFDMEPEEFVENLGDKHRIFRLNKKSLAEKIHTLLLHKERNQNFPESWRMEFRDLVQMRGRDPLGRFADEGKSSQRQAVRTSDELYLGKLKEDT